MMMTHTDRCKSHLCIEMHYPGRTEMGLFYTSNLIKHRKNQHSEFAEAAATANVDASACKTRERHPKVNKNHRGFTVTHCSDE